MSEQAAVFTDVLGLDLGEKRCAGNYAGQWCLLAEPVVRYRGNMFIKRTKTASGGKTYTYLQLVEGVRRNGRSTHQVLANLG